MAARKRITLSVPQTQLFEALAGNHGSTVGALVRSILDGHLDSVLGKLIHDLNSNWPERPELLPAYENALLPTPPDWQVLFHRFVYWADHPRKWPAGEAARVLQAQFGVIVTWQQACEAMNWLSATHPIRLFPRPPQDDTP